MNNPADNEGDEASSSTDAQNQTNPPIEPPSPNVRPLFERRGVLLPPLTPSSESAPIVRNDESSPNDQDFFMAVQQGNELKMVTVGDVRRDLGPPTNLSLAELNKQLNRPISAMNDLLIKLIEANILQVSLYGSSTPLATSFRHCPDSESQKSAYEPGIIEPCTQGKITGRRSGGESKKKVSSPRKNASGRTKTAQKISQESVHLMPPSAQQGFPHFMWSMPSQQGLPNQMGHTIPLNFTNPQMSTFNLRNFTMAPHSANLPLAPPPLPILSANMQQLFNIGNLVNSNLSQSSSSTTPIDYLPDPRSIPVASPKIESAKTDTNISPP